jgi:hypothetical protein
VREAGQCSGHWLSARRNAEGPGSVCVDLGPLVVPEGLAAPSALVRSAEVTLHLL